MELRTLVALCNFGDEKTSLICDRIVLGVNDSVLQGILLREHQLPPQKAIDNVHPCKISRKQVERINKTTKNVDIICELQEKHPMWQIVKHVVKCMSNAIVLDTINCLINVNGKKILWHCGGKHQSSAAKNNYRSVNVIQHTDFGDSIAQSDCDESNVSLLINCVHDINTKCNEWLKIVQIEGNNVFLNLILELRSMSSLCIFLKH